MSNKYTRIVQLLWWSTATFFIGITITMLLIVWNPFNLFGELPNAQVLENPESQLASEVYSSDGVLLGKYFNIYNRSNTEYKDLPESVANALIATEDVRFRSHSGIDFIGISTIVPYWVIGKKRGASTLTQQLAKNLFKLREDDGYTGALDNKIIHKLKEWIVAIQLEKAYSKEEILMMYLNTVEFGNNSYGIKAAARKYFSKELSQITTEEAALLIGLLKGPSYYNPFRKQERALARRNTVIDQMEKYDYISKALAVSLKSKPIKLKFGKEGDAAGLAPHFRNYVKQIMIKWCREHHYKLYEDGLKIYTTIDSRMQKSAEDAVDKHMSFLQEEFYKHWKGKTPWQDTEPNLIMDLAKTTAHYKELETEFGSNTAAITKGLKEKVPMRVFTHKGYRDTMFSTLDSIQYSLMMLRTGLFSMDPYNGMVRAWVGNIDFGAFPYDHVAQGRRQAGSTFKPLVYAYTIEEKGLTPDSKFPDAPIVIPIPGGSPWSPKNSNGKYSNEELTLRQGLARSVNTISAQLINLVGPDSIVQFAKRMGIKSPLEPTYSLALGVGDVTLMEMVNAYGVFVGEGYRMQPHMIVRIEDKYGNVLEEFGSSGSQIINEQTAYYMIELLRGSVEEEGGTSVDLVRKYGIKGEIGGKTGTTQQSADGWFIGVTPNLVTGVWVGGEKRVIRFSTMTYGQGARMALPIWAYYMQGVQSKPEIGYPAATFKAPDGQTIKVDTGAVVIEEDLLPIWE